MAAGDGSVGLYDCGLAEERVRRVEISTDDGVALIA
jgi:hypothetical protein